MIFFLNERMATIFDIPAAHVLFPTFLKASSTI
jgi:hypothetical protein